MQCVCPHLLLSGAFFELFTCEIPLVLFCKTVYSESVMRLRPSGALRTPTCGSQENEQYELCASKVLIGGIAVSVKVVYEFSSWG